MTSNSLTHDWIEARHPSRVVVIGAGGFVGGNILRACQASGMTTCGLGRPEFDLLAPDAVERLIGLLQPDDAVVLVSALAPARTIDQMMGSLRMAQTIRAALDHVAVGHLVHIGSDAVYGADINPVTELSPVDPSGLHGIMHLARERMLGCGFQGPLALLRPSLLYGAGDPHNGYGPNRFARLLKAGQPVELGGEGEEQRDHVFIDDVGRLVALIIAHRSRGILNVTTGRSVSFGALAKILAEKAGRPDLVKFTPRRNPITYRHFDNVAQAVAFPAFSFTPLEQGLARLWAEIV